MLSNIRRKFSHFGSRKFYNEYAGLYYSLDYVFYRTAALGMGNTRFVKNLRDKSFEQNEGFKAFEFDCIKLIECPIGQVMIKTSRTLDLQEEKVDNPFLLGATEVTQALYLLVMGKNPSYYQGSNVLLKDSFPLYPFSLHHPVERVSWYDAILFCNKLSRLRGLDICYELSNVKLKSEAETFKEEIEYADVSCDFSKNGYRLPTGKEWMLASVSGGSDYRENATFKNASFSAWVGETFDSGSTHPVAQKLQNTWGFYDMIGNVREWCWDIDPEDEEERACCGGDFTVNWEFDLISGQIRWEYADLASKTVGFRLCRSIL